MSRSAPPAPARRFIGVVVVVLLGLGAPVTGLAEEAPDPLEPANRKVFGFNDALDRWVLKPVARGYQRITPEPVERSIGNFFTNLGTPGVALNQFLQGKPKAGLEGVSRFMVNTTVGIGGLFDVAARNDLPARQEDFGQTFRVWGVGAGPFLMLPLRGPATTTHAVGMVFDLFTNPLRLVSPNRDRIIVGTVDLIDTRADLLSAEELISGDRYLFIRDSYLQRREYLVNDGRVEEDPFLDDFGGFDDGDS